MKRLQKSQGFTLMEMLIVVAIIAILVAIAIPTLTHSLETSRHATDNANIRSSLENLIAQQFTGDNDDTKIIISAGIMKADWDKQTTFGNLSLTGDGWKKGQDVYLCWDGELGDGHAYIADKDGDPAAD